MNDLTLQVEELQRRVTALEERVETEVADARRELGPSNYELVERVRRVEDELRHLDTLLRERRAIASPHVASIEEAARDLGAAE
jgi:uncharacterized protein with WD repeat